jgi:hypothetical protein
LVFTHKLNRIRLDDSNPAEPKVIVEPGMLIDDLNIHFYKWGVALPSNVVPQDVTIGGVISTCAHGSGRKDTAVCDYIASIDIVTAKGKVETFNEKTVGKDIMNAVRTNLGTFGLISEITLNVVPTYNVHVVDSKPNIDALISNIEECVLAHDFVDISWFPFNEQCWMKTFDRTEDNISSNQMALKEIKAPSNTDGLNNLVIDLMLKYPEITPGVCHALLATSPTQNTIQNITRAIHYEKTSPSNRWRYRSRELFDCFARL